MFYKRSEEIWFKYPKKFQTINDLRFIAKLEAVPIVAAIKLGNPYLFWSCLIMWLIIGNIADDMDDSFNYFLPRFLDDTPKSDNDFVDYKPIPNFRPGECKTEFDIYANSKTKEIEYYKTKAEAIEAKGLLYKFKHRAEYNFYQNFISSLTTFLELEKYLYEAERDILDRTNNIGVK